MLKDNTYITITRQYGSGGKEVANIVAKKLGIKVPKELKVIGFDGTKLIQTYHSELTTIAQPIHDIATLLVDLLLKRIAHPDEELKQMNYTLPVKLIKSETTA